MVDIEPPKRFDISKSDYTFALWYAIASTEDQRAHVESELEALWGPNSLTLMSVRTGFDAYLSVLDLPPNSEVLMSAITIPDMVSIVEAHHLIPIAIDIDTETFAPKLDLLQKAITVHTKMIVISHIFGTIVEMDSIHAYLRNISSTIIVVEDCAQAYCGPSYRGHPHSDATFFSFGTIKTATALGGAIMSIKDGSMKPKIQSVLNTYPVHSRHTFTKRTLKYATFSSLVIDHPYMYGLFVRSVKSLGYGHLELLLSHTRAFAGLDLLQGIRQRPSVPLLKLLNRRIRTFDASRLEQRRALCRMAASMIRDLPNVSVPGSMATVHYYWLFPILVNNPAVVAKRMLNKGFDVTSATTSLACVDTCVKLRNVTYNNVFDSKTAQSTRFFRNLLYLPIDATTPNHTIVRMVKALSESIKEVPQADIVSRL
jgi:perosamine synthetase